MTTPEDMRIRAWAKRRGYLIPDTESIPDIVRERYSQARTYMIRESYAQRNGNRNSVVTAVRKNRLARTQPFLFRSADRNTRG